MKKCRRCEKELSLEYFYKHSDMADGYLNFCIECTKKRIRIYREKNIEHIRSYDQMRAKLPHRRKENSQNTSRKRKEVEGYQKAHNAVARAVYRGVINKPLICSHCGHYKPLVSHHADYAKPLEVVWLCQACHCQIHKKVSLTA